MYTWEIRNFVRERNYLLTREEFVKAVNRVDNPQILDVKKMDDGFHIITQDDPNHIVVNVK